MARKERELTNSELQIVRDIDDLADSGAGEVLVKSGGTVVNSSSGVGDVSGPASSTDNAVPRFDGTGGKTLQTSGVSIDDTGKITAGANGASGLDVVTYQQLQDTVAGLSPKDSVRVATTANGTFSTAFQNGATVDGITLVTGNRILIKDQTSQDQNGIYTVNASGAPTRATDADSWDELVSAFCFIEAGSTNADTGWVCTINTGGTIGVDNIAFTQFTSSGSGISSLNGLSATSQTFATGTSGTDFNISSGTSTHTFNIPDASGTNRGAVTTGAQTIAGAKTFSSAPIFSTTTASKPLKVDAGKALSSGDIDLTSEVTGVLPVANGGTNSSSALTNDRVMVSSTGAIVESAVTATELGYLTGVTSAVQTQLDGKADDGDITASGLTMNTARIIGRTTASVGAPEELAKADVLTFLNVEDGADVTDETNVVAALSGATLTAITVATGDKVLVQDADDSSNLKTVTAQSIADLAAGGGDVSPFTASGRVTVFSGQPVMIENKTARTTAYYTPFTGNTIALYDGSSTWELVTFAETSLSLSGYTADKNYDIFGYNNAGTLTLESVVWTNDTTRATALTTQDGVQVKTGDTSRRYLGTIRINSTGGQVDWQPFGDETSAAKLSVWNENNRVMINGRVPFSSTGSWTYGTQTWRAANADNDMRVYWIAGRPVDYINVRYDCSLLNSSTNYGAVGVALNNTGTPTSTYGFAQGTNRAMVNGTYFGSSVSNTGYSGQWCYAQAIEWALSASTTFYGTGTAYKSGLTFSFMC